MNRPTCSLLILASLAAAAAARAQTQPTTSPTGLQEVIPGLVADERPGKKQEQDPLLDLPELPRKRVTLIGGTVTKLDAVQDKLTVRPFGNGKQMRVDFDIRTNFVRNGVTAQARDLRQGDRVYLDTMLNGSRVFAKTIWIQAETPTGNGQGQILDYDSRAGLLTVRDELSQQPMRFRLTPATVVKDGNQTRTGTDLPPGTLVALTFGPQQDRYGTVREIKVLAQPGTAYSFFGKITYMDLSGKMIAIDNNSDGKNYEIHLEELPQGTLRNLRQGTEVGVSAVFNSAHYVARSVEAAAPKATPSDQDKQ